MKNSMPAAPLAAARRLADAPVASTASWRARTRSRKATFLIWLRRIHLYVGLWGAALGLLFGTTGIVLNHRSILKIPVDKVVQRTTQLALPEGRPFDSPASMARWLQHELGFEALQMRAKADAATTVTWAGRDVAQPERWTVQLHGPKRGVNAEYHVGNRFVRVDLQDATPIGTLTRLHTSTGVNAFWVLLSDTIAGGLMLLCATGLLLWSRLHPVKLSGVAVALGAVVAATGFLWTAV